MSSLIPDTPASDALGQITLRNSAESPFLRLPRELRDRIWELIIGRHRIHINRHGHWICVVDEAEEEEGASVSSKANSVVPFRGFRRARHSWCLMQGADEDLKLSLLRTCRHAYFEGTRVLYATNTFLFLDLESLQSFMAVISPSQRKFITAMVLSLWKRDIDKIQNGETTIKVSEFQFLNQLKTLHIYPRGENEYY